MKTTICVECNTNFVVAGDAYRAGDRVTVDRWVAASWVARGLARVVEGWVQGAPERKARRQERRADRRERREERRAARAEDTPPEPQDKPEVESKMVGTGTAYVEADWKPGEPIRFASHAPLEGVPWYGEERRELVRVHEVAKACGHTSAQVIEALCEAGETVTSQFSTIPAAVADSYVRLHRGA